MHIIDDTAKPSIVSEFSFVCSCRLHKNDPRNQTKSREQSPFVWLRGSVPMASQSLKGHYEALPHVRATAPLVTVSSFGTAPCQRSGPSLYSVCFNCHTQTCDWKIQKRVRIKRRSAPEAFALRLSPAAGTIRSCPV